MATKVGSDPADDAKPALSALSGPGAKSEPSEELPAENPEELQPADAETGQRQVESLRNQLDLSHYEYDTLAEQFQQLVRKHSDMRKLAATLHGVIEGSPTYERESANIIQLQAEGGQRGLRAKAREAKHWWGLTRVMGGMQALTDKLSLADAVNPLVEKAGGLLALESLVSEARFLRFAAAEYQAVKNEVEKPDGLREQASKYKAMIQFFMALEEAPRATLSGQNSTSMAPVTKRSREHDSFENIPKRRRQRRGRYRARTALSDTTACSSSATVARYSSPASEADHQKARQASEAAPKPAEVQVPPPTQAPLSRKDDMCTLAMLHRSTPGMDADASMGGLKDRSIRNSSPDPRALFVSQPQGLGIGGLPMRYPVLLEIPGATKKRANMPKDLEDFLLGELYRHIDASNFARWFSMGPSQNTCILTGLLDDAKFSTFKRQRRACEGCSGEGSEPKVPSRPCALLEEQDGVLCIVFLPLLDAWRQCMKWKQSSFWVLK